MTDIPNKPFWQGVFLTIIFCAAFTLAEARQQQRGVGVRIKTETGQVKEIQLYEGSYALVIGNSEYSLGWDRLNGVKSDIVAVRTVLEKHGFKVEAEENLTSEQFERRIRKFINDHGYDRNNRLLIYYAGHGYTLNSAGDKRELGYVIPADTPLPSKDERGFRQKAVSMYAIQTFAKDIQAKHALFVFDSCFSGKLFALRDTLKITPFIVDKVNYPVRQFITAGNETQTVPDESIFRKALVRGLEGDADRNNDAFVTGTELADYLKEAVTNYTNRRQTPQYGTINDVDLDRGDFVFAVPDKNPVSPAEVAWGEFRGVAKTLRKYDEVAPFSDGLATVKLNNKIGFIDQTGREVIPLRFAALPMNSTEDWNDRDFEFDENATFSEGLAPVKLNGRWGLIDKTGKVMISLKPQYRYVRQFKNGYAKVADCKLIDAGGGEKKEECRFGFIDRTGGEVVSPKYEEVKEFSEGGFIARADCELYFLDRAGKILKQFAHDGREFAADQFFRVFIDGKESYVDKSGKVVLTGATIDKLKAAMWAEIVDKFKARYDSTSIGFQLGSFHKGVAVFFVRAPDENDTKVEDGKTLVRIVDKFGFVDMTGRVVVPVKYDGFDRSTSSLEGVMSVSITQGDKEKYGFVDNTGREVVPPKYSFAFPAFWGVEGVDWFWSVRGEGKGKGVVDQAGRELVPPKYDDVAPLGKGLFKVKVNDRWGVVDDSGREVVSPKYDNKFWCLFRRQGTDAETFIGVTLSGRKGFVDLYGNEYFDL